MQAKYLNCTLDLKYMIQQFTVIFCEGMSICKYSIYMYL